MRVLTITIGILLLAVACSADISVGNPVQVPTPDGKFTMPSFSPDGRYIAFAKVGYGALYTADQQGNFAKVAEGPLSGWRYAWSPTGNELAYRMRYGDSPALAGMVATPDGQSQTQVTDWQNDLFPPEWGKDGIKYKAGDDLMTLDETGKVKVVKSLTEGQGIVSRVIALSAGFFANNLMGTTATAFAALVPAAQGKSSGKDIITNGDNQLWVIDENGDMKQLLNLKDESGYFSPETSPDGSSVAANGLSGKLYVADVNSGNYVNLGAGQDPSWSPDGRFIAYEVASENGHDITGCELWIASRDGSWKKQLDLQSGIKRYPSWSPDGKMLVYEVDGKIYYVPVGG